VVNLRQPDCVTVSLRGVRDSHSGGSPWRARTAGENSAAHFSKGPLQAYQEEYEFGDYGATLTEARLGNTGVLLREQYFSPVS